MLLQKIDKMYQIDLSNENQDNILSTLKSNIVDSRDEINDQVKKKKSNKAPSIALRYFL